MSLYTILSVKYFVIQKEEIEEDLSIVIEKAKKRKEEEEEKQFLESREAAFKKLQLLEEKISARKSVETNNGNETTDTPNMTTTNQEDQTLSSLIRTGKETSRMELAIATV